MSKLAAWRIVHSEYRSSAFSGIGAEMVGGRFNSPGTRMVYTASTLSLAMLEILFRTNFRRRLKEFYTIEVRFDDKYLSVATPDMLPLGWDSVPQGTSAQSFGDSWIENMSSVALAVPSVVVPEENNILFNPAHPTFDKIEILDPAPLQVDDRISRILST